MRGRTTATITMAGLTLLVAACGGTSQASGHPSRTAPAGTAPASAATPSAGQAAGATATPKPTSAAPAAVTGQLVTVTAPASDSTTATVTAYNLMGSTRVKLFGPWTAHVGSGGIAAPGAKREGDLKTPSGTYGFSYLFGTGSNPGFHLPYRQSHSYDYWDDDPSSANYNEWVDGNTGSTGASPERMDNPPFYTYGAVIAYNTARTPGLGSAIFFHVDTGAPTTGCVTVPTTELLDILHWLDPAKSPKITIQG